MYYSTTYQSPVGVITIAGSNSALVGLWNENQKYHGGTIVKLMTPKDELPIFYTVKKWLDRYFAYRKPSISELPIAPIGTDFRQTVWDILCDIPYGEVITYGDIAKKIAVNKGKSNMSCQAVGGAVGHNPVSIIIPCHRVVGSDGSLTGYAGGISVKVKLLELEGVDTSRLYVPKKGTAL